MDAFYGMNFRFKWFLSLYASEYSQSFSKKKPRITYALYEVNKHWVLYHLHIPVHNFIIKLWAIDEIQKIIFGSSEFILHTTLRI